MFSRAKRARGMTLLEIMAAAAIGLVIVAAAFSMFAGMSAMQERADRKMEALAELNIATQRQLRIIENAGSNLKTARLSIRVQNDLQQLDYWDVGAGAMAQLLPMPRSVGDGGVELRGFVQNSDVVDILQGYEPLERNSGMVFGLGAETGSERIIRLKSWSPLATEDQIKTNTFVNAFPGGPNIFQPIAGGGFAVPKFLVFSGLGSSCLMKVKDITANQEVRVEHVLVGTGANGSPNFYTPTDGPTAPTFASNAFSTLAASVQGNNCPQLNQTVYAVGRRTLYAVARVRDGDRPGLFEFPYDFDNERFSDPVLLSVGVDDMAVHPMVTCGMNAVCDITDGGANASDFPYTGPTGLQAAQVVGVSLRLISRGLSDVKETAADAGITFADGTPPTDNLRRDLREAKIPLNNLNPNVILPD